MRTIPKSSLLPALLLFFAAAAAGAPPVGQADFVIESGRVNDALNSRQVLVTAALAAFVAERAEAYFGFVDWAPGAQNARFALIFRLVEEGAGNCPPTTKLKLDGSLGTPIPVSGAVLLYEGCDPHQPYIDDPVQFDRDVKAAVEKIMDEPVRRTVLTNLLAKVPVATTLQIDHAQMHVFLPVRPDELKASEQSQLTVQFEAQGTSGQLRLTPFGPPLVDRILCRVSDYVIPPPLNIVGPNGQFFWHDSFERIFPAGRMPRINVYMTNYIPDPFAGQSGIANGIVTTGP